MNAGTSGKKPDLLDHAAPWSALLTHPLSRVKGLNLEICIAFLQKPCRALGTPSPSLGDERLDAESRAVYNEGRGEAAPCEAPDMSGCLLPNAGNSESTEVFIALSLRSLRLSAVKGPQEYS